MSGGRLAASTLAGLLTLAAGCADGFVPQSTGDACHKGEPTLQIGEGVGTTFRAFEMGESVQVREAPQGGFGIPVRGRLRGLHASEPSDRLRIVLDSYRGQERLGTFENDFASFFCGEDGYALFWGTTVGFDPERFGTREQLAELHGEPVTLELTATDRQGTRVTGRVEVILRLN